MSSTALWLQAVINGIALGWLYVLMALGLTLILSIMGILQLAHGEIYMLGAFAVYYFVGKGLGLYPAIVLSMVLLAAFGVILERGLFRTRPGRDPVLSSIVISTGLTLILASAVVVGFGLYTKSLPYLWPGSFTLAGATVPKDRLVAIAFSVVALLVLYAFLKQTRLGLGHGGQRPEPGGLLPQGHQPQRDVHVGHGHRLRAGRAGRHAGRLHPADPALHGRVCQ